MESRGWKIQTEEGWALMEIKPKGERDMYRPARGRLS